jgi:hypothetical protein
MRQVRAQAQVVECELKLEPTAPMELSTWLSAEIDRIEALLQGSAPTCQLDRQQASPPSLKEREGRYFVLRRTLRLLERHQPLQGLTEEADKARAALAADSGLARNAAWAAYFKGVLGAVADVQARAGTAWAASD